jgi:very-short-patch-repair endonuclease
MPHLGEVPAKQAEGAAVGAYNAVMPPKRSNSKTMHRAGELRREPTPAERKLWAYLRRNKLNGVNFRRQHAIGNFITDFVSIKMKLVIELDGSQHLEQEEYDIERTKYLESQGYKVVRFWNNDVMNDIDGVLCTIEIVLGDE